MYNNAFLYITVYFEAEVIEGHSSECFSFPDSDVTEDCVIQEVVSFSNNIVCYNCIPLIQRRL
jgi:hypothetical protein